MKIEKITMNLVGFNNELTAVVRNEHKLCEARQKWSTYEHKLFDVVRALDHWKHYLTTKEFILRSDHHAL